ncbi:MAG: PIG-L family deacetylase [Candidatus Acidiferrales bacterium]
MISGRRWVGHGMKLVVAALAILCSLLVVPGIVPGQGTAGAQSLPQASEAIEKARISTRILYVTAHPDDEWASLLAYLARGKFADVAMLQITRGQGGQNAIGPEQGEALGVIRTEELLAAGRHYGVRQYFTRAPDFGFSKSADQTLSIWGQLPLEDMVRVIRTFRPQIVINGWGGTHWGHGQHQASGILTPQAVAEAADPKAFPDQIAEGLAPWKVEFDLRPNDEPSAGSVELATNDVSPIWGVSYVEMGMEGHAQHRSQGTPAYFNSPFFRRPVYLERENIKGDGAGGFDGKVLAEPITTLATRFPAFQSVLDPALATADQQLAAAEKSLLALDRTAAAQSLAAAGDAIVRVRAQIAGQGDGNNAAALWELDRVRERIDAALTDDIALPLTVQASRHELVAGEGVTVEMTVAGKPAVPVKWSLEDDGSVTLPSGWGNLSKAKKGSEGTWQFDVKIPAGAKTPSNPQDAILPFPPPLLTATLRLDVFGYELTIQKPVQAMEASTTGIETYPLTMVPAVTLSVEPKQVIVPAKRAAAPVQLLARVRYHGTVPAKVAAAVDAPKGWTVVPIAPLAFSGPGDELVRFEITPPAGIAAGAYPLHPYAKLDGAVFRTSLETIPTLPTRTVSESADAQVHILDLTVPAGLHIGYVAAENDALPDILRQLGIRVDLLDEVTLAFGDLSRYDAIVIGIRAYELRPDVVRSNRRLLDYVESGGTLLVQYQRDFAWNKLLPAPFKAVMPEHAARVTDPNSPVRFLAPDNPLLNTPNKITQADFQGWEQERGIYFWGTFGEPYQAVLGLKDPGEPETNGSLVYARDGKGVYIYTGLSFFRELPAGVPGAYRLFINLISQTLHSDTHD